MISSVAETLDKAIVDGFDKALLVCLGNSLRSDTGISPCLGQKLAKNPGVLFEDAEDRLERVINLAGAHIVFLDVTDFVDRQGLCARLPRIVILAVTAYR